MIELQRIIKEVLPEVVKQKGRNLYMPGDGRYQSEELKPFLGYDMWAAFLIIVEWFWLMTLAKVGAMPPKDAALLTHDRLFQLLLRIPTTRQDKVEKITHHDILALLQLMRQYLPKPLHKWLHLGATSYDPINTAYALIINQAFKTVFWPKLQKVDGLWRGKINEYAKVVQAGRTHLQTALPVTVGFWLACLHHQFIDCAYCASSLADQVPGKFTGAVGTSAALNAMLGLKAKKARTIMMTALNLKSAEYTTQITPPQDAARFYFELLLLTGVQANLGEDTRILQSSQFGEIVSAGSTSSTMAHKKANPVAAENNCGMHADVIAEFMKVVLTLVSDLQRDLRWSSVMRSQSAVMVYAYQQLLTTERLLNSMAINEPQISANFNKEAKLVVAELLHLCLQRQGYFGTHELVNKIIVPRAAASGISLPLAMEYHLKANPDIKLRRAWKQTPENSFDLLKHPAKYIGDAIELAQAETENKLET